MWGGTTDIASPLVCYLATRSFEVVIDFAGGSSRLRERKSVDSIQIQFIVMYLMKKPQCQYWVCYVTIQGCLFSFRLSFFCRSRLQPPPSGGLVGGPFQLLSGLRISSPKYNFSFFLLPSPFIAIIKHVWSPLDYSNISISLNHPTIFRART